MLKQLSVAVLSMSMLACGGGSSSGGSGSNGISQEINPSLSGPASAPQLSTLNGNLSDGSTIPLNTVVNSSIQAGAELQFSFVASEDMLLAVVLDGADANDSDLDLVVDGVESINGGANEAVVIQVIMGETVSIELKSFNDNETSFELTVVRANRESLRLMNNEFVVLSDVVEIESCNDGAPRTRNDIAATVFNFSEGYARELMSSRQDFASSSTENALRFTFSESGSDDDGDSFSQSGDITYTVDVNTGDVSASGTSSETEVFNGQTDSCASTLTATGNIVL
ncbi:hypothetical protein [Bacterioplanoides sp.]|uniref:hypothetical protein n=1 Tax=Bacterioplanoides sp. TaxID=2066072 RepID=UPI003B000E7A